MTVFSSGVYTFRIAAEACEFAPPAEISDAVVVFCFGRELVPANVEYVRSEYTPEGYVRYSVERYLAHPTEADLSFKYGLLSGSGAFYQLGPFLKNRSRVK